MTKSKTYSNAYGAMTSQWEEYETIKASDPLIVMDDLLKIESLLDNAVLRTKAVTDQGVIIFVDQDGLHERLSTESRSIVTLVDDRMSVLCAKKLAN